MMKDKYEQLELFPTLEEDWSVMHAESLKGLTSEQIEFLKSAAPVMFVVCSSCGRTRDGVPQQMGVSAGALGFVLGMEIGKQTLEGR